MGWHSFTRSRWTVYIDLLYAMLKKRYTEAKFLSVDVEQCKVTILVCFQPIKCTVRSY